MIAFKTQRLRLRSARIADLEPIHAILSDLRATAYWSTPPHRTLEQSRQWLQGMMDIPADEGEDFIIELDGRVIGKAGLYRFPEIGFILHPDAWGFGFATEALHVVLDRAFNVHLLGAVKADVDPRNSASLRLLTKLGFREVGRREKTWLVGEEWCDSVDLQLETSTWVSLAGNT